MKRIVILSLILTLCILMVGCFASQKDETSTTSTEETTATTLATIATSSIPVTTTLTPVTTAASPASISEFPCTAYATDSLNVRRTPNTDYYAVGGLSAGEAVTVIGKEGDFYQIEFKWKDNTDGQNLSGTTAYVSAAYISLNKAATPATTKAIPTATTGTHTTMTTVAP